ncbi:hypothetical protein OESDEN_05874 [Oesophagostomum dentatum]|uniref:Uncharacterized protein n=1 Tax=Oesophagostomum dentatum TaxID=61180 RepID=A0A0B1TFP8_OESDE|nr:hypothetical protein OESDEN_05874 [Oesophagostomum dentatum]
MERVIKSSRLTRLLDSGIVCSLQKRGVKEKDEWREYLETMERNGDIVAKLSNILNVSVLQIVDEKSAFEHNVSEHLHKELNGNFHIPSKACPTGAPHEPNLRSYLSKSQERDAEPASQNPITSLLQYVQSLSCPNPGVFFTGKPQENSEEFIRKFRRKYDKIIIRDTDLMEILADGHLGGHAKNLFRTLSPEIRSMGFETVVRELGKLLSGDTVASRMKAMGELRNLKIRQGQDIAEFCIVLERLGKRANPDSTFEEKPLEYAQILLENLKEWPEYVQLVAALHRVAPEKANQEIKQIAISIEQAKRNMELHGTVAMEVESGGFEEGCITAALFNPLITTKIPLENQSEEITS